MVRHEVKARVQNIRRQHPETAEPAGAAGLEHGQVGPNPRANTKIKILSLGVRN